MAELQASRGREVVYIEFLDGSRELRLGAARSADVPIRGDIGDLVHTQPSHGMPSGADLDYLSDIIKAGSPLREVKVVAPDGTLYVHHLDSLGRPLRGPRGRLQITVVRP